MPRAYDRRVMECARRARPDTLPGRARPRQELIASNKVKETARELRHKVPNIVKSLPREALVSALFPQQQTSIN